MSRSIAPRGVDPGATEALPPRVDIGRVTPPRRRHSRLCERSDLLSSLDESLNTRVTLIVAPAGYGKTTLLAQWCERLAGRQMPIAYYTASRRDRDPTMFLAMLTTALAEAGIGADERPAFNESRVRDDITLDDILLTLELSGQPLVLVIDDFERVNEPAIADLVTRFIEAAPLHVHLVLAARVFPAIPLSMLELEGKLRLIDTYQLRLRRADLAWMLDLDPEAQEIGDVFSLTQGWPATAELYRLWRQRSGQPGATFGGHVVEVHNYLTEQLFSSLPAEQLDLLIDIADRDEISAGLVDSMRGRQDSAALLAEVALAISSLMWSGQENGELVYRLHPLLLDHLRQILSRDRTRRSRLATAATFWYLRHHRFAEAVRIAVEADDPDTLDQVVQALRPVHILVAEGATALRIILRELPEQAIARYPRLQLMSAIAHFKAGFFGETAKMLARLRASTKDYARARDGSGDWLAVEGCFLELLMLCQLTRCGAEVEQLHARMIAAAPDDPIIWGSGEVIMMLTHQVRGDFDAAEAAVMRGHDIYSAVDTSRYVDTQIAGQEILILLARGRLREAAELIGACQRQPGFELPTDASAPTLLRLVSAAIRYEQDFSEAAVEALGASFAEHSKAESWFDQYAISYPALTMRIFIRNGLDAVLDYIAHEHVRARSTGIEAVPDYLTMLAIGYRARSGKLSGGDLDVNGSDLAAIANQSDRLAARRGWRERDLAKQTLAQVCLAEGDGGQARETARLLAESGKREGRLRAEVKGWVLAALAEQLLGDHAAAIEALRKAVLLAYPQRFVAPFAEEGSALLGLIDLVREDESLDAYAYRHLNEIRRAIVNALARVEGDRLNARELEIVGQLALGLSNKMIARRLGITDHTVKFHLKKIFSKLEVSSRRAAVAKIASHAH